MSEWQRVPFRAVCAEKPPPGPAKVFVGLPSYGQVSDHALDGIIQATMADDAAVGGWHLKALRQSLLAYCFNGLVCSALNTRDEHHWTHFALHHADIGAQPGWLDLMVKEMAAVGADVLSAVVPIKDDRGLTSTGLRHLTNNCTRRLTMKEVLKLPETFTRAEAGAKDGEVLAINTGLLLFRLDQPWVTEIDDDGCLPWAFNIKDKIRMAANGKFVPLVWPEDWQFSSWCARRGLKVFATRKVKLSHYGESAYNNDHAWGNWDTEQGDHHFE